MPKVLHISYSGVGGLAEVAIGLFKAARQAGGDHEILFYGVDPLAARYEEECQRLGASYRYVAKGPGFDRRGMAELARVMGEIRPDVVIGHLTQPVFAFLRYKLSNPKAKLISVEHHSNALKSKQDWVLTFLNHWAASRTVYLTDEYLAQVKKKLGPLVCGCRVSIVPNGIDTQRYSPLETNRRDGPLIIGMQGRMVESKDYTTLFHAFHQIQTRNPFRPIRLEVAGDGPMEKQLRELAGKLGISNEVSFLGLLSQDDLIAHMRSWDVFVLSTLGETMSRALMEAQSLALPIVATDVSGVSAAIRPGFNGLLVPAKDAAAMAGAIDELLNDSSARAKLGEVARAHAVAELSVEKWWARYENVVNEVFA